MNPNVRVTAIEVDPDQFVPQGRGVTIGTGEGALRGLFVSKNSGRLLVQTEVRKLIEIQAGGGGAILSTPGTYASGDLIGGLHEIDTNYPGNGVLESVVVIDGDKQNCAIDLFFLTQYPDNSTFTDNIPPSINASDRMMIMGVVKIAATDYVDANTYSVASKLAVLPIVMPDAGNVYVFAVARGTPTYTTGANKGITINALVRPA